MTLFYSHVFFLLTLFIIALGAIFSFKRASRDYWPLLLFFITLFVFETAEFVSGNNRQVVKTLITLQYILEVFLVIWQARLWGVFDKRKKLPAILVNGVVAFWFLEQHITETNPGNVSWFRVITCFLIIIMAIEMLNRRLLAEKSRLFGNTIFQFSIALIFYYTFTCLLEIFMLIAADTSKETMQYMYYLTISFAVLTNFIYLRSLLCIPKQTKFSLS